MMRADSHYCTTRTAIALHRGFTRPAPLIKLCSMYVPKVLLEDSGMLYTWYVFCRFTCYCRAAVSAAPPPAADIILWYDTYFTLFSLMCCCCCVAVQMEEWGAPAKQLQGGSGGSSGDSSRCPLESMFSALEQVLPLLRRRRQATLFKQVRGAVEGMCGRTFTRQHLARILFVQPGERERENRVFAAIPVGWVMKIFETDKQRS